MKSFIEVIKEADETQAKLKFIQDPKSSSKSIANLKRSEDPVVRNAAEEELKRRRDSGDQDAAAHVDPIKDASIHTAQTQVGGEQAQAQEKETKTKEVEPNRIAPFKKGSGKDILNNLNKGKTISGDTPNAIELNPQYIIRADGIKEAAMKSVVFSFGRMNPPTVGHEKLVDKIQAVAKANKADARLFLSRTEGDDKNPLPYSDKLKLAKMAFPGIVQDTPAGMLPAGFIGLLKMLEDKYDKVIIVVGSDRLANIKSLANKYNGSEYKFEEIEVVSAGERDPDEEGVGGMSASKMRAAAKAGDLVKFKSGLPSRLKSAAKLVMDKLKQYLSEDLDEAVLTTAQRLKRRAVMRRIKGKIRMGQRRALRRKANTKVISRRSKRIAIRMMRKRILRGRKYSEISLSARQAVDRQVARRKTVIVRIAKRIEPKLRRAEASRRSGQGYKSISLGPVKKKKLKEGMSRDNLIQSVNTIMKRIIAEQNYSLAPLEQASLIRKSNETGVPINVIKEVYARGVTSWNMGLREDTTPQQWGFARVNSFLAGGFNAYTADRDLLEADDGDKHKTIALIKDPDTKSKSIVGMLNSDDPEIKDAADKELKKRRDKGDQEAGTALDTHDKKLAAAKATQAAGQVNVMATPSSSVGGIEAITKSVETLPKVNQQTQPVDSQPARETPLSTQEIEARASRAPIKKVEKAVEAGTSNQDFDAEDLDKEKLPPEGVIEKYSSPETFALLKSQDKKQKLASRNEIDRAKMDLESIGHALRELDNSDDSIDPEDKKIADQFIKKHGNLKKAKRKLLEQQQQLHEAELALGELGLTDQDIKETRPVYKYVPDKRVVEDGTHNKLLSEADNILSTLLTEDIDSDEDYSVAGNLGSSFNEVSSGAAHSFAVENNLDLSNIDDHMKMACHAFNSNLDKKGMISKGSKLDLLGKKEKSKLPKHVTKTNVNNFVANLKEYCGKSVNQLNDAQILSLYVVTEMAKAKTIATQRAIEKLGWDAADLQSTTLAGSRIEKRHLIKTLKEYKKNGGKYVVTGGEPPRHLDIDQAIIYAKNGGGGQNSSDTTILVHNNKTGEIYFNQTSDKSNPSDQTGNTTVNAKHEKIKSMLNAKKLAGVITEQQYKETIARVEKSQKDADEAVNKIANSQSGFVGNIHAYLSSGDKNAVEATKKAFMKLGKAGKDPEKYYNTVLAHYDKLAKQGVPGFKPNAAENEKFKKVIAHINDNPGLDSRDKLAPSADLMKAIRNLSKETNWETKNKPEFGDTEADKATAEAIFRSEELLEESLNEVHPDLGSELVEREQLERCHMHPVVEGALTPSGNPQSCDGFTLILGPMAPTAKEWRECTGLTNMADLHKNVSVKKSKTSPTGGYGTRILQVQNKDVLRDTTSDEEPEKPSTGVVTDFTRRRGDKLYSQVQTFEKDVVDCLSKKYSWTAYPPVAKRESFLSFGDFLEESADKAVGNVPVINAKPIHHKASSHKYHIHHMMDPNVALKHQVKDFSKRIDKDVDSDIDQFDKPSSKLPDEVSVPTKKSTAQFFAKYKKEREHIHAGEPVDESSHQYTGNEDSWYIDASGQKVQVMHDSDLKNPEDVSKYLKDKNPDDNIGKMMSMNDFLKTQPEKKKK
jgi:hypothetical protein